MADDAGGHTGPTRTVRLKTLDSEEAHELSVPIEETVVRLKQRVEQRVGVPASRQRLIFQGRVLRDERPLSFYDLEDGAVLHVIARPEGASMSPSLNDEPARRITPTPRSHLAQQNIGQHSMLVGTLTLPDDGSLDLTQLMNRVMAAAAPATPAPMPTSHALGADAAAPGGADGVRGGGMGSGTGSVGGDEVAPPSARTSYQAAWTSLRHCDEHLHSLAVDANLSTPLPRGEASTPPSREASQLAALLRASDSMLLQLHVHLQRLSAALAHEGAFSAPQRRETHRFAAEVAPLIRCVGDALGHVALAAAEVGSAPRRAVASARPHTPSAGSASPRSADGPRHVAGVGPLGPAASWIPAGEGSAQPPPAPATPAAPGGEGDAAETLGASDASDDSPALSVTPSTALPRGVGVPPPQPSRTNAARSPGPGLRTRQVHGQGPSEGSADYIEECACRNM